MTDTTKRRLLQPRKDVLREQLALAADEIQRWKELAMRDPLAEQSSLPAWGWLVLAALSGAFVVAVAEAFLA